MSFLERFGLQRPPKTSQDADKLALRHLASRGSDLSKPRHVIHFLLFANEHDARTAATQIDDGSWTAQVEPPAETGQKWIVRVDGHRVVGSETVAAFRTRFEDIAAANDGEYDGWEAAAKP